MLCVRLDRTSHDPDLCCSLFPDLCAQAPDGIDSFSSTEHFEPESRQAAWSLSAHGIERVCAFPHNARADVFLACSSDGLVETRSLDTGRVLLSCGPYIFPPHPVREPQSIPSLIPNQRLAWSSLCLTSRCLDCIAFASRQAFGDERMLLARHADKFAHLLDFERALSERRVGEAAERERAQRMSGAGLGVDARVLRWMMLTLLVSRRCLLEVCILP